MNLAINSIIQSLYLTSSIVFFGLVLNQLSILSFSYIYSTFGYIGVLLSGFIGTPIHEFGHLIMAIIFGHNVTDVKFFRLSTDGVLGYVSHSFNPTSIYQNIGNFFIGIAPLFSGAIAIMFLMKILLPESHSYFIHAVSDIRTQMDVGFLGKVFETVIIGFKSLLRVSNFTNIRFYIFVILSMNISSHMSLSLSDIQNSLMGFVFIIMIFFLINVIFLILNKDTQVIYNIIENINLFMASSLSISLVFSLLFVFISGFIFRVFH